MPKRLSFDEIDKTVERYASIFYEQGLRKDDIAIIQLPNIVELPMVYLALSKLEKSVSISLPEKIW